MNSPSLEQLETTAEIVYSYMPATPQYCWPLLSQRLGCEVWVKHENYTPTGAFKVRGGIAYLSALKQQQPTVKSVVAATKGNHGQSVGYAAKRLGLAATIFVPKGNSMDKNRAMKALGVDLIEYGDDFQEAMEYAAQWAAENQSHMVPSFDTLLAQGIASYGLELLRAAPHLDTVYVPIGLGSGICGVIAARNALGLKTKVVGVVSEKFNAYALSFQQGEAVSTVSAHTIADGLACRTPNAEALDVIFKNVERIVSVSDQNVLEAIHHYYTDTHNIAEGAGAAALAGLIQEKDMMLGKAVGIILSGGNIDKALYLQALSLF